MRSIRYALAGLVAATMVTAACTATAASGADRVAPAPSPLAASRYAPAAALLPPVQAGVESNLGLAVQGAVDATREEKVRAAAAKAAAEKEAAAPQAQETTAPALSCEPDADARLVGNIIVNKDCPALTAAKEKAQRDYAEGYPLGGAEALEQERAANAGESAGKSSGELQFEYGCQQGYIPATDC